MHYNPYLPFYEYVPDGEPHIFKERLYVYGSHDSPDNQLFCPGDYVVWSCPLNQLTDWKYEGVSYRRTDDPHNRDGSHALFAPDVAKGADGKYYLFYCLDFLQEIGVARSDDPQGPFTFYGHVHYPDGRILHEYLPYDPSVLVDEDGSVYLYYGFAAHFENGSFHGIIPSPGCMVVQLDSDMLTVKQAPKMCLPTDLNCTGTGFAPEHAYFEAPSIRKYNGLYFLLYSSQSQHELCYATSRFPDKEFEYRGVIISNGDIGLNGNRKAVNYTGTNHGGMVQIGQSYYVFYHRNTHSLATSRQGCAEKVELDKNGFISQVGVSSYGLSGMPFKEKGVYPSFATCYLENLDTSPHMTYKLDFKEKEPYYFQKASGEKELFYIANMHNRCLFGYNAFDLPDNAVISLRLRGNAEGKIVISADREAEIVLGNIPVHLKEEWTALPAALHNKAGVSKLYFTYYGTGTFDFEELELI